MRYVLAQLQVEPQIAFHHDTFEFNNGSRPPHNFDLDPRMRSYAEARVVYLVRDPRDIMVSLYFQITGRFRDLFAYEGTISEFIRDDYFGATNLQRFREMWGMLTERHGFLTISYEQCHGDMNATVHTVLSYYALAAEPKRISAAVENAEFSKMKRLEQSGSFPDPWLRAREGFAKVRQGKIGGFADALEASDIAYLNEVFGFPAHAADQPRA